MAKKCADACKRPAGASYETKPQCHPIVPRKLASVANDNPVEQCAEGSVVRDIKANVKSCATKKEDGCKKSSACKWTDDKCESQYNSSIEFESWDAAEKKAAKNDTPESAKWRAEAVARKARSVDVLKTTAEAEEIKAAKYTPAWKTALSTLKKTGNGLLAEAAAAAAA